MISLTLHFQEASLPKVMEKDQAAYVLAMLKEHPKFAMEAASVIEVKSDFGKVREVR